MNKKAKRSVKKCNTSANGNANCKNNDKENKDTKKKCTKAVCSSTVVKEKETLVKKRKRGISPVEYVENSYEAPNTANLNLQDINNNTSPHKYELQNIQTWKKILEKPLTDVPLTREELGKLFEKYKVDGHYRANSNLPPFTIFLDTHKNKCNTRKSCFDVETNHKDSGQENLKFADCGSMGQTQRYQIGGQCEETNRNCNITNQADISPCFDFGRILKERSVNNDMDNEDYYVQQNPLIESHVQDYMQYNLNANQAFGKSDWCGYTDYNAFHNASESNVLNTENPCTLDCNNVNNQNIDHVFNKITTETTFPSCTNANNNKCEKEASWMKETNAFNSKPYELNIQLWDTWVSHSTNSPSDNDSGCYNVNTPFIINYPNIQNDCSSYMEAVYSPPNGQTASHKSQWNTINIYPEGDSCVPGTDTISLDSINFP